VVPRHGVNLGILPKEPGVFIRDFADIGIIVIMFALAIAMTATAASLTLVAVIVPLAALLLALLVALLGHEFGFHPAMGGLYGGPDPQRGVFHPNVYRVLPECPGFLFATIDAARGLGDGFQARLANFLATLRTDTIGTSVNTTECRLYCQD
jgi:hypothetical protein